MPIKVTCACGASFAAKDELAGRTVKCPKCQQPLTIPKGAALGAVQPQRQAAPVPQAADPYALAEAVPSIFDEAGIKAKQHTGQVCPSCYHAMKPGAIICIHCGYSLQLGRKMETQIYGRGEGGHGELAATALQRAANLIEEDKEEEKKKLKEGLPWWAYLILFCAAVGLLTMMMLLPPATATGIALFFLWGGGVLLGLYAHICILIIAFRDSAVHGICCLLVPCYAFIYTIMHWDECGTFFLLQLASGAIQTIAEVIFVFVAGGDQPAELHLPARQEIAIIRSADESMVRPARSARAHRQFAA